MTRMPPPPIDHDPTPPSASVAGVGDDFSMGMLDLLLNFRLRRIRNHLTERYRRETQRLGLKAGAFGVLALIDANPGISQIDLARFGGYDQTALVGILYDLEERGWVKRSRDPVDRRRHRVEIESDGKDALAELFARATENERDIREALTREELEIFRVWLDKMYKKLL